MSPESSTEPDEGEGSVLRTLRAVEVQSPLDAVLEQLLGLVAAGFLKPGDRLPPEVELASRLRVGRSTIREAKQILGARGILEFRGTRGCFVAHRDGASADSEALALALHTGSERQLDEARRILEVGVVRLVATRITQHDVSVLRSLLNELKDAVKKPEVFWPGTIDFHVRLVAITDNPILERLYALVATSTAAEQLAEYRALSDPTDVLAIHHQLLDAIATGEPDSAEAEMLRHLDESHHKLTDAHH